MYFDLKDFLLDRMEADEIQNLLFQRIKEKAPSNISLVDELANLLGMSNDIAYRRIRGEKQLSISEVQKLSTHYNISLDQLR